MSSQDWLDKAQLPSDWYNKGKFIPNTNERLAYYTGGLTFSPEFHPNAWRGIGETLYEQRDSNGALDAFKNEEKSRQRLEPAPFAQIRYTIDNPPISQIRSNNIKFCPTCGASVPEVAQFCAWCGVRLGTGVIEATPQTILNASYQPVPCPSIPYQLTSCQKRPINANGKIGLILGIIGFFIIPLAVGSGFMWMFFMEIIAGTATILLGIPAMVFGVVGRRKDRDKTLATASICVGAIASIYGIAFLNAILSAIVYPFYPVY